MDPAAGSGSRSEFWQLAWAKLPPATVQSLQALSKDHNAPASSNQDVDHILKLAREKKATFESKQWEVELGSRSFKIRNGLSNIIDWLQKFKEVGDIAVNFDPVHAALPWAAFRFLLQAATTDRDSIEGIITVLELVSRIIQHGRVFEKVHILASENAHDEQHVLDGLKETVVDLYVAVLESLDYCCTRLDQSTGRRFLSAFPKPQEAEKIKEQLVKRWNVVEDNARSLRGLCHIKIFAEIKGHLPDVLRALRDLKDVSKILVKIEEKDRYEILDNISKIKVGSQHKSVHDRRTKATGKWLLVTPEFRLWETDERCPITLLYGSLAAGAGKTFLISRVIDHIKERLKDNEPNCGLAYFYCDRNDIDRRQPNSILSSLVCQLASPIGRGGEVHQYIQELDKKLRSERLEMDLQLCQFALAELASSYQSSSIVLDALDECDEETRNQLMCCMEEIVSRCPNLKIFISSRTEYDIKKYFSSKPTITIQATDNQNDIRSFIREKLTSDARWNSLDQELREETQSTLLAKSGGMFQWANLQVQELLRIKHLSNRAIRECLWTLPSTLDETYEKIWKKINTQSPIDRKIARRAIKWALSMYWDVSTAQLVFPDALRVDDETESLYDIDETPSIQAIEGACYNLLIHNPERKRWHFCHLSAAEYMESTVMSGLQPQRDAAMACLKQLLHAADSESPPVFFYPREDFRAYARQNWHYHVRNYHDSSATKHPPLEHLIERFLGSATQSSKMYHIWADEWADKFSKRNLQPSSSPLFGIAQFGLLSVLKEWYDHDSTIDLNVQNEEGLSLLGLAARDLNFDICQFLVAKGVNIDAGTSSPLATVCSKVIQRTRTSPGWLIEFKDMDEKVKKIATLLIDKGADVNARDTRGWTPLNIALERGNKDLVTLLLEHNAEVGNASHDVYNATAMLDPDLVRFCLNSGAAINEHEIWSEVMVWVIQDETEAIEMLLKAGMDVNYTPRNERDSLLNIAASCGHFDLLSLLIKAGANPNPKGVKQGPIYQAAASKYPGGTKCIKKLFSHGAALNPREGISPLVGACDGENALHRSKLLLDLGADPNHIRHSESPLLWAARLENKALFQLFLKAGADPNSKNGLENALVLASRSIQQFHSRGPFPEGPGGDIAQRQLRDPFMTFLKELTLVKEPDTAVARRWLLDAGADPTLTFVQGPGSALAFAAFTGNVEACSFLLDQELGVDVNAKLHGWFGNVLHAAMTPTYTFTDSWNWKSERQTSKIISLLFEAGADILPMYKTLPPSLPAINIRGREYFISSAKAVFDFSKHWLSIIWDIGSSPKPHLPLSMVLRRYKLPYSIPPSASILIKLTPISTPPHMEYSGIFVFSNETACFIFDNNNSKFKHSEGTQTTAHVATFERTGKSCESNFPLTSSINPLLNHIFGLAVFIGFVLYLKYAFLRSE
ncbi:unnamed protein product [Clonostachys byssicola]|uniref:Nephrocystin 3-like N-terminal domain-containing protein n=1 Tax=Clonostachys byssicola TaxID=160290 RepID=A0A9N9Y0L8_9HYPO|nr:unnamed protein product [Clonostachys byssicola]